MTAPASRRSRAGGKPHREPTDARTPAETVSQPSYGQVTLPTARTDSDPSALWPASRQRFGVSVAFTSCQ
ncbi:hypothetical protein DQ384_30055 [Sphaerisporangium album]|uniref:Uncharacterized protein n=1 Tax=Sphaerisporangium album TaxID=509200 RepID=A0A367F938_9ACTN|nr:hypothetical protein DQ384_30055 [Sphaerisporangium album]